jgi:NitT/TauT family transport system ATP-binding protein
VRVTGQGPWPRPDFSKRACDAGSLRHLGHVVVELSRMRHQTHEGSSLTVAVVKWSDTGADPAAGRATIVVDRLRKVYPSGSGSVVAIEDVSFAVKPGEFIAILGPSGCGKSTLMMVVAGLRPRSGGNVLVNSKVVDGPQTDVGIVFQQDVLLDWRTNLDNVLLQVEMRKLPKRQYIQRAQQLLESVGLEGFEQKHPYELSGGMRQRVSICRALVHDPDILLMDEPFGALDALTREQMTLDLQALWMRRKKSVLFITHSIPEAVFLSDRVLVMSPRPGRVDEIIDINLPRPRSLEVTGTPSFNQYTTRIREIFQARGVFKNAGIH